MIYQPLNLTNREAFRLNCLSTQSIENLIDIEEQFEDVQESACCIDEAINCYPSEDFMQPLVRKLESLMRNVRGDNKLYLKHILETAIDIENEVNGRSEYGRSELKKVLEAME